MSQNERLVITVTHVMIFNMDESELNRDLQFIKDFYLIILIEAMLYNSQWSLRSAAAT